MESAYRVVTVLVSFIGCQGTTQATVPLTTGELFRAKALVLPARTEEFGRDVLQRAWDLSGTARANFTFFSDGVRDVRATRQGVLGFGMDSSKVTLGWGNYDGKQPFEKRVSLWSGPLAVRLHARQPRGGESTWALRLLADGRAERTRRPAPRVSLEGDEWQRLTFERRSGMMSSAMARPDGFALEIEGGVGHTIQIKGLEITRQVHEGYLRKEFELPEGGIWRAAATVGNQVVLHVNGTEVPSTTHVYPRPVYDGAIMYCAKSIDLKPYLKPGKNCVGIYGFRVGYPPYLYLQSQVVMASGEAVRIDTDETWRWSPQASRGWSEAGSDDAGWRSVSWQENWADPTENALAISSWNLRYKNASDRPAYDGYLVLENTGESRLFYTDVEPVVVKVRTPRGLARHGPVLDWSVRRYRGGSSEGVSSGRRRSFSEDESSLVWELNLGRLARGVYTIHCTLTGQSGVLEKSAWRSRLWWSAGSQCARWPG